MSPVLTVVVVLLIPAGLLPILTAWVLRRYRNQPSSSLRDRWHLSLVLAALGGIVAFMAANSVFSWGFGGEALTIPFGLILLAADLLSGRWLLDHWRGRFDLPAPDTPEEIIERAAAEAREMLVAVAEETARQLARAELERNLSRTTKAAEETAENTARIAENTDPKA